MPHHTTAELFALPPHEAHALLTDQELAHARKALAADVLERAREQGHREYDKAEADNIVDGRIQWTLTGSCEAKRAERMAAGKWIENTNGRTE